MVNHNFAEHAAEFPQKSQFLDSLRYVKCLEVLSSIQLSCINISVYDYVLNSDPNMRLCTFQRALFSRKKSARCTREPVIVLSVQLHNLRIQIADTHCGYTLRMHIARDNLYCVLFHIILSYIVLYTLCIADTNCAIHKLQCIVSSVYDWATGLSVSVN